MTDEIIFSSKLISVIRSGVHNIQQNIELIKHKINIWNVLESLSLKYWLITPHCLFLFAGLCSLEQQGSHCQNMTTLSSNVCTLRIPKLCYVFFITIM